MQTDERSRNAIKRSTELAKLGKEEEALGLLDQVIDQSFQYSEARRICTLCHHAAVIARSVRKSSAVRRYYEQSLRAMPENPRALYGLAMLAFEAGDSPEAKRVGTRCHAALIRSDEEILKQGLLDLVQKHWPDLTGTP